MLEFHSHNRGAEENHGDHPHRAKGEQAVFNQRVFNVDHGRAILSDLHASHKEVELIYGLFFSIADPNVDKLKNLNPLCLLSKEFELTADHVLQQFQQYSHELLVVFCLLPEFCT